MSQRRARFLRSGHAHGDIRAILAQVEKKGRCLDLPSGRGVNAPGIRDAGFEPVAADLFPGEAHAQGITSARLDFTRPLPFAKESFAAVVCSEGIEHHAAQQWLVEEFARVLQPGGSLLLTTPNVLNLRGRLAAMLNGHYSFRRSPISEITGLWREPGSQGAYVGHCHMINYFELRFILKQAGFALDLVTTAKYALSCAFYAPLLWLPVQIATRRLFRRRLREHPEVYREICRHALSPDLLFGQKLIVLARRER